MATQKRPTLQPPRPHARTPSVRKAATSRLLTETDRQLERMHRVAIVKLAIGLTCFVTIVIAILLLTLVVFGQVDLAGKILTWGGGAATGLALSLARSSRERHGG